MNVVIFAGGTGSIALQHGLFEYSPDLNLKIITNALDNGLSTGMVRKVLDGKILGPSDVRKNQTTRLELAKGCPPLSALLALRFSETPANARAYCLGRIDASKCSDHQIKILKSGVEQYFSHPVASKIDYSDFSLANIVYAGLANANGNSLRKAATIMAEVMGIPDNILLNDDASMFLGAVTASGVKIDDEGDIVCWNNSEDPIVGVHFTDPNGLPTTPVLCDEAKNAIEEADLIILSSGTQWSSLIPTYESKGFKAAMERFTGRVIMVMNRQPDKDAPSMSADDLIKELVPKYFREKQIDLIMDSEGAPKMRSVLAETADSLLRTTTVLRLGVFGSITKHSPHLLAKAIFKVYFSEFLGAKKYVFDYDDTLIGRGNSYFVASDFNRQMILRMKPDTAIICTGNSIKAVNFKANEETTATFRIYADGGINKYLYTPPYKYLSDEEDKNFTFIECVDPDAQFATAGPYAIQNIISILQMNGIPAAKIENRGNVMLSIKPIDPEYRDIVRNLAAQLVKGSGLAVKSAGRTTVEIAKPNVSKETALKDCLVDMTPLETLVYVGDELDSGNDSPVKSLSKIDARIKCLAVKNPQDTALFLQTLNS